jgi:hypothetical protein
MVVFHDQILIEEADGLFGGSGGKADEEGIEIFEDLTPEIVDGAMAFVGNNKIEGLDGDDGIVGNVAGAVIGGR